MQSQTHTQLPGATQVTAPQTMGQGGKQLPAPGQPSLQSLADASPQVQRLRALQDMVNGAVSNKPVAQLVRINVVYEVGSNKTPINQELATLGGYKQAWYDALPFEAYDVILKALDNLSATDLKAEIKHVTDVRDKINISRTSKMRKAEYGAAVAPEEPGDVEKKVATKKPAGEEKGADTDSFIRSLEEISLRVPTYPQRVRRAVVKFGNSPKKEAQPKYRFTKKTVSAAVKGGAQSQNALSTPKKATRTSLGSPAPVKKVSPAKFSSPGKPGYLIRPLLLSPVMNIIPVNLGKYMRNRQKKSKPGDPPQLKVYEMVKKRHEEELEKDESDLDLAAALHWASEELYIEPKAKRSGGGGGKMTVKYKEPKGGDDDYAEMNIAGRPGFEPGAVKLPGVKPGHHRRHIIAWHTIRGSIANVVNQVLYLQKGKEGIDKLNDVFTGLLERLAKAETEKKGKTAEVASKPDDSPAPAPLTGKELLEANLITVFSKLNSNTKNLWPGEGYQNSLINTYQSAFRKWAGAVKKIDDRAEALKWQKATADEIKLRMTGKRKSYIRTVGAFWEMIQSWELPKADGKKSVGEQLSNFLNRCADSFEVDFPYGEDRKGFESEHTVYASILNVAGTMLEWADEENEEKFTKQNLTSLVATMDAVINQFMFPEKPAPPGDVGVAGGISSPKDEGSKSGDGKGKVDLGPKKIAEKYKPGSSFLPLHPDAIPLENFKGLQNIGNSCYIASVLVMMHKIDQYADLFESYAGPEGPARRLATAGDRIFDKIDTPEGPSEADIRSFRTELISTGWLAADEENAQQDAALLLTHLIDTLTPAPDMRMGEAQRREASRRNKVGVAHSYKDRSQAADAPRTVAPAEYSPLLLLENLTGGHRGEGRTMEQLIGANLNDAPQPAMQDDGEVRDHHYKFTGNLPQVLTIQLKRFNFSTLMARSFKLLEQISSGRTITINQPLSPDGQPHAYSLKAFIMHLGGTPRGGHYVSYVKVGAQWYYYNDATQYGVPESDALENVKNAYVVTYEKT